MTKKKCGLRGCERTRHSQLGYCSVHYKRVLRHGTPKAEKPIQAKHGYSRSITYRSWQSMKTRCENPKTPNWKYYGGRGIKFPKRWSIFLNFLKDMGKRPSAYHSLDRIKTDQGYSKQNCRWSTAKEQARNKTNVRLTRAKVREIRNGYKFRKTSRAQSRKHKVSMTTIQRVVRGARWA